MVCVNDVHSTLVVLLGDYKVKDIKPSRVGVNGLPLLQNKVIYQNGVIIDRGIKRNCKIVSVIPIGSNRPMSVCAIDSLDDIVNGG